MGNSMFRQFRPALLGLLATSGVVSCSSPEALVPIDIYGDEAYSNVTLTLLANSTVWKTASSVSISAAEPLQMGMYLPSKVSGAVTIAASVDDGTCVLAAGTAVATGVAAGKMADTVILTLVRTTDCAVPPLSDGGVGGGDDGGSGGAIGTGSGGRGSGGTGSGATIGTGGGGSGTGGVGATGTGGAVATGGRIGSGGSAVGGGGAFGSGGRGSGGAPGSGGVPGECGLLIDDMEANNGRVCTGNGRVGHWFAYVDATTTSSISPPPNATSPILPAVVSPARGTSLYAMNANGRYSSYAGIGCLLNNAVFGEPPKSYDASAYSGIRFYAKGTGGLTVMVNTSATTSTTYGGTCSLITCLGASYRVTGLAADTWNLFTVPFASLQAGSAVFRAADIWTIEFQPNIIGSFNIWVDDIVLY